MLVSIFFDLIKSNKLSDIIMYGTNNFVSGSTTHNTTSQLIFNSFYELSVLDFGLNLKMERTQIKDMYNNFLSKNHINNHEYHRTEVLP